MVYFAAKEKTIRAIHTNAELQSYVDKGWMIAVRDDNNVDTKLYENGVWLADRPDVEDTPEKRTSLPNLSAQITQTAADVAYLSMMTGVSL